jgi:hypothetical protein
MASIPHPLTPSSPPNFLQILEDTTDAWIGSGGNSQHNLVNSGFKKWLIVNTTERLLNASMQTKTQNGKHVMIQSNSELKDTWY